MSKLKKVIQKYYPYVMEPGEKTEDTAARIIEEMQQYKHLTMPEIIAYVKQAVNYMYPNSTGVPEQQQELLNEFFSRSIKGEIKLN